MNKYIAIIAAEDEEVEAIKNISSSIEEINIKSWNVLKVKINGKYCLLVKSGIGKVNSGITTQMLLDHFDVEYVVNVGSAGGLKEDLKIADVIIGEKLVQHDYDLTGFGRPKGEIPGLGIFFESNKNLIEKVKAINVEGINKRIGTIGSGDIFCTSVKMKNKIVEKFNADCVEMEGAAIAQVCAINKVPFVVIRSISDIPNEDNYVDFKEFLKVASKNCGTILKELI